MTDSRELTARLGGTWYQRYGTAPCPVCQPEHRGDQNALSLRNGDDDRLLLHCKKSGCGFRDILAAAGVAPGDYTPPDPANVVQRQAAAQAVAAKKERQALICWREAQPIRGTIAESYLRGRGINCSLPESLRFHPECWHGPSSRRLPAMVALVDGGERFAIHRTYLRSDGTGKAEVAPAKLMLSTTSGGAVHVAGGAGPLVVAEGIETALSLACGLLNGPAVIWAALATSGLRALHLPNIPARLTIATDGDTPGRAAGHDLAQRATALGWTVCTLPAPQGRDWNDVLMMRGTV